MGEPFLIRLYKKSIPKQRKYQAIVDLLGSVDGLQCLDIGSDNGVISYLLRQRGGNWKSADLDNQRVNAALDMVKSEVYRIDGHCNPFQEGEFDLVVIVDFLEHIPNDQEFMEHLSKILKPGGSVIINVPHKKDGVIRRLRLALGQTDERHGHLRPGYTIEMIEELLGERFYIDTYTTYSRFFSELIDAFIIFAVSKLTKNSQNSEKGLIVTEENLKPFRWMYKFYSFIYPFVWLISRLDALLFLTSGYKLIARVKVNDI